MSPTSYQTAPPRNIMVAYVLPRVKLSRYFRSGVIMAPMSRTRGWLMLASLSIAAVACGSRPADPKALPSWIAAYPGSPPPEKTESSFIFQTKDPPETVINFYERQLAQSGVHKEARGGGDYGGFLAAADDSHTRNVMIDVRPDKGVSQVSITVVAKK